MADFRTRMLALLTRTQELVADAVEAEAKRP
jgi:hypothetical protein